MIKIWIPDAKPKPVAFSQLVSVPGNEYEFEDLSKAIEFLQEERRKMEHQSPYGDSNKPSG